MDLISWIFRSSVAALLVLIVWVLVYQDTVFLSTFTVYIFLSLAFVWFRWVLWFLSDKRPRKYRSWNKPFTVIVPVKNESPQRFLEVLGAILDAEGDKQVLVGSDGSNEENYAAYKEAVYNADGDVTIFEFESIGKRSVQVFLHEYAEHEVVVNVDSDVLVSKDAFTNLLAPFSDARVGMANGRLQITGKKSFLEKYYSTLYLCANQVGRKSMGWLGIMPSASGELLAYRKKVLDASLDRYEFASFLGKPITFGEDRLLTNLFLEAGYKVVYCENSLAKTWGKDSVLGCLKQQLRWRRSWTRESIKCLRFAWKRPLLMTNTVLNLCLPVMFSLLMLTVLGRAWLHQDFSGLTVVPLIIMVTTVIKDFPLIYENRNLTYPLTIFAMFNLFLITPLWLYAVMTADSTDWGSRKNVGGEKDGFTEMQKLWARTIRERGKADGSLS